mgnify:CR=1 FL=1
MIDTEPTAVDRAAVWAEEMNAAAVKAAQAGAAPPPPLLLHDATLDQLLAELDQRVAYVAVAGMPLPELLAEADPDAEPPMPLMHLHGDLNALSGILNRVDEGIRSLWHGSLRARHLAAQVEKAAGVRPATAEETVAIATA